MCVCVWVNPTWRWQDRSDRSPSLSRGRNQIEFFFCLSVARVQKERSLLDCSRWWWWWRWCVSLFALTQFLSLSLFPIRAEEEKEEAKKKHGQKSRNRFSFSHSIHASASRDYSTFFFLLFVVVEINPPARLLWTCYRCSRSFLGGGGWKREEREEKERERERVCQCHPEAAPPRSARKNWIHPQWWRTSFFFYFVKEKKGKTKTKLIN